MSAGSLDSDDKTWVAEEAAAALAEGRPYAGLPSPAHATALAWALKERCQRLWGSEPAAVAASALALRRLSQDTPSADIAALADWAEGIATLAQGDMPAALNLLDAASAAFTAAAQPLPAAQVQVSVLMALSMLGRHQEAATRGAATQRALVAHGDTLSAAKLSLNLGSMLLHQDEYAAAAAHYREAGVLFARSGQMQLSVMADIGLADAQAALGEFEEAQRMLARAGQRAAHHGLPMLQAMVSESTALLALAQGRYAEALAGLEASRRGYETLNLPQHLATAEKQLADAYLELNLLPEALALYAGARARFEAQDMPQELAWALVQQGRAQARLGQSQAAAASLLRAGEVFAQQHTAIGPGAVALARAALALQVGQPAAAQALAEQAESAFRAAGKADGPLQARLAQAQALAALGGRGDAQALSQARALYQQVWQEAQAAALPQWQARAQAGLGLVAWAQGDATTARPALQSAVDSLEDLRRTLPGDELRSAMQADHLRPYEALLSLALQAVATGEQSPAQVLQQLDRYRARTLGERLITPRPAPAQDVAEQAQRTRLNWLYRRLRRSVEEGNAPAASLVDELRTTEHALLEKARRQRLLLSPHQDTLPPDVADTLLDTAALRAGLGPGEALLAYGVEGDELFACLVQPTGITLHRYLAAWPEVLAAVQAMRFQLESLGSGSPTLAAHLPSLQRRAAARLQAVHGLVWAPLMPALQQVQRVLIVPHGALAGVPFAALHDGTASVGEQHQLAMAPSARVALHGLARRPPAAAKGEKGRRTCVLAESSRLPQAAHEARQVAACHGPQAPLIDAQVTLAALQQLAPDTAVLHIACHAQFRSDNPMFSALHLHDGAATAEWIETLHLPPATVVLSACETGLGAQGPGDETLGLVRAFLLAGAGRVVASLWPVDDRATQAFMLALHHALAAGEPCAAALQQARAQVRATQPHPFYWAGFTAYGGF